MATTDFRILGPLEVTHDGALVGVPGARQRALLAILLLHAGEAVSIDRLIDELWGDEPPEAGATALRVRISQLRRALGPAAEPLVTRAPGYVMALQPDQLDLRRFERLVEAGDRALSDGDPAAAADTLREALTLWRGPPLADFHYAPFAQGAIVRLEELRLAAIELRIEAELALGRHARLVGELRELTREHPLREGLWRRLMLALYRDGRQAEALEAYREARRRFVDELGLEPGPELQELERRILDQDVAQPIDRPVPARTRSILVLSARDESLDALAELAAQLAAAGGHELLIAAFVDDDAGLTAGAARLRDVRAAAAQRGVAARVAAFTSADRAADAVRLATEEDVALLVLDAPDDLLRTGRPDAELAGILSQMVCDVALVAGAQRLGAGAGRAVLAPFGGHEHDWAAVELGAWFANGTGVSLRLAGTRADSRTGRRDASRLLAHASIALQRGLGVDAEPVLVEPGTAGIVEAADDAALVVLGLSDRWAREGVGTARLEIARRAAAPVVLVRRGLRPSGVAPARALTRFTWSAG